MGNKVILLVLCILCSGCFNLTRSLSESQYGKNIYLYDFKPTKAEVYDNKDYIKVLYTQDSIAQIANIPCAAFDVKGDLYVFEVSRTNNHNKKPLRLAKIAQDSESTCDILLFKHNYKKYKIKLNRESVYYRVSEKKKVNVVKHVILFPICMVLDVATGPFQIGSEISRMFGQHKRKCYNKVFDRRVDSKSR
ncbi:MAG: hypothetical protein HRT72_05420 [Flavobacteriales bacterium]|nr:hypothetical protein [Flavobacteriales bacterium]